MAVLPTISLGGGLVPPIGALIGTIGANSVMGAITNTGTPLDWSQYDQSQLTTIRAFHQEVIAPFSQAVVTIANSNISALRDEMSLPVVSIESLKNPTTMMRDVIMSIPEVSALALDGRIWGYGLSTDILENYAQGGRPYELMVGDLGDPVLPTGYACYNLVDNDGDTAYYHTTTIVSGNEEYDNFFNNLSQRQLSDISDTIYQVRRLMDTTLIDPTAPDCDRG